MRNLFNRVIESFDGLIYYKFKFSVLYYTFALEVNSMIGTTEVQGFNPVSFFSTSCAYICVSQVMRISASPLWEIYIRLFSLSACEIVEE